MRATGRCVPGRAHAVCAGAPGLLQARQAVLLEWRARHAWARLLPCCWAQVKGEACEQQVCPMPVQSPCLPVLPLPPPQVIAEALSQKRDAVAAANGLLVGLKKEGGSRGMGAEKARSVYHLLFANSWNAVA